MRYSLDDIIGQKNFYRGKYRGVLTMLMVSLFLNAVLALLCFYFKITEAEPDFYTTHPFGVTQLQPRDTANYSDRPLLQPDPPEEGGIKRLFIP